MKDKRSLTQLSLAVVFILIASFLLYATKQYVAAFTPIKADGESARGYDDNEENTTWMKLEGEEKLSVVFDQKTSTIINQTYRETYNLFQKIYRHGVLEGEVTRSGSEYSFVVRYDDGKKVSITVKLRDISVGDYDIVVKEQR